MNTNRPILYVEDDQDSVFFLRLAFKKAAIENPLVILDDGDKAVKYLLGADVFADRNAHPLPCLVLLDIKLPQKSGFEVLQLIRKTPAIKTLPTVILTSSPHPSDILKAREIGADHYLVKPFDIEKLAHMVSMVYDRFVERPSVAKVKNSPVRHQADSRRLQN